MIRKNMAPYIVERLLFFKKNHQDIKQVSDLFVEMWEDPKVRIDDFEFKFHYELRGNIGKLNIKVSPLEEIAEKKLIQRFETEYFPIGVKKNNLILKQIKFPEKESKDKSYLFKTELISINDKKTYTSVFEYFVRPLIF